MIMVDDIVTFWFTPEEQDRVMYHARQCSLGGRSNIRGEEDRQTSLIEDQLFGQFCELVGWMTFCGRADGFTQYNDSRETRNKDPWASDNGNDIVVPGVDTPIDVKGSKMRYGLDPLAYNLVYPLREHNDETLYLLCLSAYYRTKQKYVAHVVGFIVGHEMPPARDFKTYGKRRWISATELHPMSDLLGS